MASVSKTKEYFLNDYQRGLFPLDTNRVVIENAAQELSAYIYENILNEDASEHNFLPQARCYASKHGMHLRRTLKLDPVAEFFIYDLVYRNRSSFRRDFNSKRKSFGHRFESGRPIPLSQAYRAFKEEVAKANRKYKYSVKFDIATYFNSLYHHDLVQWFDDGNRSETDADYLGQFLRQINSGRSVDCLPQGIHPCKVIGAEFLKYIDNASMIKSEYMLRYMDDIYLFSDRQERVESDFILIQQLLGEKALNINVGKTKFGDVSIPEVENQIEAIRLELLKLRAEMIEEYDSGEDDFDSDEEIEFDEEHEEYLMELLKNPDLEDIDAELILTFLGENGEDVAQYLHTFFEKFPNLSKKIYYFCEHIEDIEGLASVVLGILEDQSATEEQLFWLAKIAEDYLSGTDDYSDILINLYEHPDSTVISQSKVLEIPEKRFGIPDLREQHLRVGKADWLAWSSAVGSRSQTKRNRNHLLGYFSNVAQVNYLIAECVKKI